MRQRTLKRWKKQLKSTKRNHQPKVSSNWSSFHRSFHKLTIKSFLWIPYPIPVRLHPLLIFKALMSPPCHPTNPSQRVPDSILDSWSHPSSPPFSSVRSGAAVTAQLWGAAVTQKKWHPRSMVQVTQKCELAKDWHLAWIDTGGIHKWLAITRS